MTIEQLQQKRDELIQNLGVVAVRFGERSIQYGNLQQALAAIDAEIQRLQQAQQRAISYAEYSRG